MYRIIRSCARQVCRDRQQGRTLRSVIGRLAVRQTVTAPRVGRGRLLRVLVQTQPFVRGGMTYAAGLAVARWAP